MKKDKISGKESEGIVTRNTGSSYMVRRR